MDNFRKLSCRQCFPDKMPEFYFLAFEKLDIPAQQDTVFFFCNIRQLFILPQWIVVRIKTSHPKFSCKFANVCVYQESDSCKGFRSEQAGSKHVNRSVSRKDIHRNLFFNGMVKRYSLSVDLDVSNFSVGYAKGFNEVFYGGTPVPGEDKRAIAATGSSGECCKPAVKMDIDLKAINRWLIFISATGYHKVV